MSASSPRPPWMLPGRERWGSDPEHFDPEFAERVVADVGSLFGERRWFGLSVTGWEHLPEAPALIVSNHSGGTTIPDVWGLMVAWFRRFGVSRVCHPMAHDMVFALPRVAEPFARLGILRARPALGHDVLTRLRRDLFVCPGGDRDTWRPYRDRHKVNFSGRRGYAKLALRTGVAVTPVANVGAHESLVVLTDGARFARALHLPELFRAEIFPVHLSLPWGLGIGPLPHIPLPVHLRYQIGPIVPFPDGWSGGEPSAELVTEYDKRVRAGITSLLDQLSKDAESVGARARRAIVREVRKGRATMRGKRG